MLSKIRLLICSLFLYSLIFQSLNSLLADIQYIIVLYLFILYVTYFSVFYFIKLLYFAALQLAEAAQQPLQMVFVTHSQTI